MLILKVTLKNSDLLAVMERVKFALSGVTWADKLNREMDGSLGDKEMSFAGSVSSYTFYANWLL